MCKFQIFSMRAICPAYPLGKESLVHNR